MKRIIKTVIIVLAIILGYSSLNRTLAYYNTNVDLINTFSTEKYKFSINATGGSFNKDKVVIDGKKVSLPTPIRKGYTFLGFSSVNNGNVEYTNDIDDVKKINNKNIYAKWNVVNYKISYDLDGGNILGHPISYNVENTFTLPIPNKRGYEFLGWTGTGLNGITKNVVIANGNVGNRSYKANWKIINYSISYNLNGGSIVGQPTYTVNDSYTLPTPTRTGYVFLGWTGTDTPSLNKKVTISKGSIGNRNYTANWRKYDANDFGGVYIEVKRDGTTWAGTSTGSYNVGTNSVHSGNWLVTVNANETILQGTLTLDSTARFYEIWVYQANDHSKLLGYSGGRFYKGQKAYLSVKW